MQTAYLNWFNQPPARDNPAISFQAPHPHLDTISGDITKLAENHAAVHAYLDRTNILNAKGEGVINLRPVISLVQYCAIVRLNHEIQTKFDDGSMGKQSKDDRESSAEHGRKLDEDLLLTVSDLEYTGLLTTYLRPQGEDDAKFTISGAPIALPLPNMVQRHLRQVYIWDETALQRINTTVMTVLNMAYDMTPFPDLVNTLYALHGLQTVSALLFNRAQGGKVQIMNFGSSLGYRPTPTGADILCLMKDVRVFSLLMNIFTEQPLFPTNPMLIQQVLDGLLRMVHLLPDHVRTDLHTSLQIFAARFKLKETVLPMAVLINTAAIVQPPLLLVQGVPQIPESVLPVMITADPPVHDRSENMQQLHAPRVTYASATAMVARQAIPDRKRVSGASSLDSGSRREVRPETGGYRDLRPSYDRRPAAPSASAVTLEDLQRSMAALQSQVDRQARLARRDNPNDERQPPAAAYHIRATGPPGSDSSGEEPPVPQRAFGLRAPQGSAHEASDN